VPVRLAVALTPWPGVSAEKVENLVTRHRSMPTARVGAGDRNRRCAKEPLLFPA
jgi:hypothetical protein